MKNSVTNKIIFITGASSGIGEACARYFAKQGAKLILCARRQQKLDELANELQNNHNCEVKTLVLDVANRAHVEEAIATLPSFWQDIDVLINNAGAALGFEHFYEGNLDDWDAMIDTNIKGLLYLSRAIAPLMIKRNMGHIVNIGSIAGHQTYPKGNVYCATKHAVNALTQCFKLDLSGYNIRITSVDPGMVETEFSQVRFKQDVERAQKVYEGMTPLTPEDIADTIDYVITRPAHVNISEIMILPVDQSSVNIIARDQV